VADEPALIGDRAPGITAAPAELVSAEPLISALLQTIFRKPPTGLDPVEAAILHDGPPQAKQIVKNHRSTETSSAGARLSAVGV